MDNWIIVDDITYIETPESLLINPPSKILNTKYIILNYNVFFNIEYDIDFLKLQSEKDIHRMNIFFQNIKCNNIYDLSKKINKYPTNLQKKIYFLCSQTALAYPFVLLQNWLFKYNQNLFISNNSTKINVFIYIKNNTLSFKILKFFKIVHTNSSIKKYINFDLSISNCDLKNILMEIIFI